MVDAGGGNGIISAMKAANIAIGEIHDFFVTHVHTDHILGAVWVIRYAIYLKQNGRYPGMLNFYGNADVIHAVREICRLTYLRSYFDMIPATVRFIEVADNSMDIVGCRVRFFNVGSQNVCQTGFRITLPEGTSLTFFGDEALTGRNLALAENTDALICGAYCREADADIFHPYEKHHHTVADVARLAQSVRLPHLILIHCEDTDPSNRAGLYAEEAARHFSGKVTVPTDLSRVQLS